MSEESLLPVSNTANLMAIISFTEETVRLSFDVATSNVLAECVVLLHTFLHIHISINIIITDVTIQFTLSM